MELVNATDLTAGYVINEDGYNMLVTSVEFTSDQIIVTLKDEQPMRRAINAVFYAARPRS